MAVVEWDDVQGLMLSGFSELPHSAFVLWKLDSPRSTDAARDWMRELSGRLISSGKRSGAFKLSGAPPATEAPRSIAGLVPDLPEGHSRWAINLALTRTGLEGLGVPSGEVGRFASEFQYGMAPEYQKGVDARRSNLLGDTGRSSPTAWAWGGRGETSKIDGMLLLYASCPASLDALVQCEIAAMRGAAVPLLQPNGKTPLLPQGCAHADKMGHLRFADGISQPIMKGSSDAAGVSGKQARISLVEPGEFVLGYPDERDATVSYANPLIPGRDLARNGSYLVVRQMALDVDAFERCISTTAARYGESEDWVASRLIGRGRDGEPLIRAAADSVKDRRKRNDFLYVSDDPQGLQCPIGSHIRRAHPRDMVGPDPETALRLSRMHRILRRGRTYGTRADLKPGEPITEERGLFFMCLNASISGQFELIQHSWLNNTHFGGLYDEADTIGHTEAGCVMTIQSRASHVRMQGLERFVTIRGGAYFFLPGLHALQTIAG